MLRFLEESNDLLARHRREPFEKVNDCIARLDVIEQGLHRNSCAIEHCGAAHHLGASADNWLFHAEKITPTPTWGTGGASALCSPGSTLGGEVDKEVVEQFVARLRRRILQELEEAIAREPSK